jgi:hypothetical protein
MIWGAKVIMNRNKKNFEEARKWHRYQFFGSAQVSVPQENISIEATIANISFSGIGLYSAKPVGKGRKVEITIAFIDRSGKPREDKISGKVDWQKKFQNMYLTGIIFDEEPNVMHQPKLVEHLIWLIDTNKWPQPFKDKRIAML